MGQQHDVGTSLRIDRILIAPHIVRCIVEPDSFMVVDPVLREVHIASVFWSELVLVTLIRFSLDAAQYVVFEARNEILEGSVSMAQRGDGPQFSQ